MNPVKFKANYIEPEKQFLSELIVSNNGTLFLSDGTTMEYPEPAYTNGYVQFSYKVLETTNCQGINFPLNAVLYQYAPLPNGKSPEDLYPAGITKLSIQQIDVGGHNMILAPVPTRVVALDKRLGLKNDLTMNYDVTNDQYYSLTNARMEQLADIYKRMSTNIRKHEKTNTDTHPPSDAWRYADLKQAGSRYQQTQSDSDRKRLETDKQALMASGYFVEVVIPVSDLHAKIRAVETRLADTFRQSGAYYEAKLDWTTNEVRLICCKSDVPMWQKSLQDYK